MKIAVVGSNHAGTAAINTILDNYKGHTVMVFDQNSNISFLGCGMALWIGGQIEGPEGLFYSSKEKMEEKTAKVHMETTVKRIDFDNKTIYAEDKNGSVISETYDKLILATGSLPISPDIPGKDLKNVQYVKLFQDAKAVVDKLESPEIGHVTVIGAGYIGVELAEAFQRCGKRVRIIDLESTCLSRYFDADFTDLMCNNLKEQGIELRFGEKVLSFQGTDRITSVVTDKGECKTDMAVLAIGFRPNVSLGADKIALHKSGAYKVDLNQRTSLPDVYAVGDCATVYDNARQDTSYIALATNAVRSGVIAGHNVCGTELQSVGVQGSNGISIFGLNMVSTGLTEDMARRAGFDAISTAYEDLQKPAFIKNNNHSVKLKIVYDKTSRRILGAQIASKEDISMGIHMFSLAIEEKVTIDKLKLLDIFFLPHFNQPYNYITMAALTAK